MHSRVGSFIIIATAALGAACAGKDPGRFEQAVTVTAGVQSTVTCSATAQAITIDGEVALDGLVAKLILRNNQKGTHEATEDLGASLVLVGADANLAIPTQTVNGQPVADPVVSVQFLDEDGHAVSEEIVLGSCAQGTLTANATAALDALVSLDVAVAGCANHPGPTITVSGDVTFSGLKQRIIVRDGAGGAVAGEVTAQTEVTALKGGETLSIPKQPVRGGVGGNPWIYLRLMDGEDALTDELLVGRCVELSGGDEEQGS